MRKNVDYISFDSPDVETLPNGFMTLLANLTRTGIFTYQKIDPDGSVHILRQLRLASEQNEEMLATLMGLPLTNTHPSELLNPQNADDFIVGMSSDTPKKILAPVQQGDSEEEEFIQQRLTVFDQDTIEDISQRKKTKISLGYTCNLDFTPGEYKGQPYDCIQRNVRVNHVSLVRNARGGSNCKVILDGKEETINLDGESFDDNDIPQEENVKVFKFKGKEYKVEDSVHELLTSLEANMDEADTKLQAKNKEFDKLVAQKDDLESKLQTNKDADDKSEFRKAVKARVSLEAGAGKVLGEDVNLDGLEESEIKQKVIKKLRPSVSLDGKSEEYVDARFDVVMEDFKAEDSEDDENTKQTKKLGDNINNNDSDDIWDAAENARKKAWERDRKLSMGEK